MTRGFGYNSVVDLDGESFHVQTEPCRRRSEDGNDDGLAIETTIFRGGQVHYTRRVECAADDEAALRERVRQQHGAVIAELRNGQLAR